MNKQLMKMDSLIAENKKRRDKRTEPGQRHPVSDRRHDMFANTEKHIATARGLSGLRVLALQQGLIRTGEVGRAPHHPWDGCGSRLQRHA